jgi:hypothetical protein
MRRKFLAARRKFENSSLTKQPHRYEQDQQLPNPQGDRVHTQDQGHHHDHHDPEQQEQLFDPTTEITPSKKFKLEKQGRGKGDSEINTLIEKWGGGIRNLKPKIQKFKQQNYVSKSRKA